MTQKDYLTREERAQNLLANPNTHILRVNDKHFQMKSLATNRIYDIYFTESGLTCNCPDHIYRKVTCKHALAISLSLKMREEARQRINPTVLSIVVANKATTDVDLQLRLEPLNSSPEDSLYVDIVFRTTKYENFNEFISKFDVEFIREIIDSMSEVK